MRGEGVKTRLLFVSVLLAALCVLAIASSPVAAQAQTGPAFESTLSGESFADAGPEANQSEEALFAGYVSQQFSVPQAKNVPQAKGTTLLRARKQLRRDRLNVQEKLVYDRMEERTVAVAAGKQSSTVLTVPFAELGIEASYTAAELGVSTVFSASDPTKLSDEASQAVNARLSLGSQRVMCALMADHPYEMYWFDKTTGVFYDLPRLGTYDDGQGGGVKFEGAPELSVSMTVSAHYSPNGAQGGFAVDVKKTAAASVSAENAREIVARHAALDDYAKLKAYADEIITLTDYNSEYAEQHGEDGAYGDPWQLVYLFDGDPSTKVVCEGYSKGFQYLCDLSDFSDENLCADCLSGNMFAGKGRTVGSNGPHMWNVVRTHGKNYLVDLTNCDCIVDDPKDCAPAKNYELFMAGARGITDSGSYDGCFVSWQSDSDEGVKHWFYYYYDSETLSFFDIDELVVSETSYMEDNPVADAPQAPVEKPQATTDPVRRASPLAKGKRFKLKSGAGTLTYLVVGKQRVALVASKATKRKGLALNTVKHAGFTYRVERIAAGALKNAKVKTVTMGSNVRSVDARAFAGCRKLETVVLGANLKTVKAKAFYGCKNLKQVTLKSRKLAKASCKNLVKGTGVTKVKLAGTAKKAKKAYRAKFPKRNAGKKLTVA